MAKYRQIHVSFWQDGFILTLPPEEKYFYLYLMTNSKTTQCGIYELPLKVVEMETGLNSDKIFGLIYKFVQYKKIQYNEETREVMLLNWLKHNSLKSPKVMACAVKELEQVKHIPYLELFETLCNLYKYPINTLSIPYPKGYKPVLNPYGEEREQEREREQQQNAVVVVENPFDVFEREGFGTFSEYIRDEVVRMSKEYSDQWVCDAMRVAVKSGKRKLTFVEGVLKNWKADGRDSYEKEQKPAEGQVIVHDFKPDPILNKAAGYDD